MPGQSRARVRGPSRVFTVAASTPSSDATPRNLEPEDAADHTAIAPTPATFASATTDKPE